MNPLFRKSAWVLCLAVIFISLAAVPAHAAQDTGRFAQGFYNTTTGALEIPYQLVNSTLTKPFPFGVVDGAVRGTVNSVTKIFGGLFDMGAAAAPYAKYAVFFV